MNTYISQVFREILQVSCGSVSRVQFNSIDRFLLECKLVQNIVFTEWKFDFAKGDFRNSLVDLVSVQFHIGLIVEMLLVVVNSAGNVPEKLIGVFSSFFSQQLSHHKCKFIQQHRIGVPWSNNVDVDKSELVCMFFSQSWNHRVLKLDIQSGAKGTIVIKVKIHHVGRCLGRKTRVEVIS
ncbi:hypothetical protein PGUG_01627 [Meyerozyma guilliermondii ATCC 6260]|uniref:Uncharacterized protein n=1 Tax=Meyerozyma guilliermondii (strain ATCC 6260 / CBS 566 / DSM 6381 / JCM 1539 / NBRC 10279 / NRRL Y-324) TaxID=294746 RepID=A5DEC6_PICGU|nr:uncharacterized protein PGUG_01627 [Meyerozyma guilliermondii ATCC 6260]EDK37529.2 hypothetical protein PGUG_01627 [Meyerozyma guilliermondii ATCC 6260]